MEIREEIYELSRTIATTVRERFAEMSVALGKRVRVDEAQSLTPAEQEQARVNIGAAAAGGMGGTTADAVTITGAQTISGVKTFSVAPVVPAGAFPVGATTGLQDALDAKAGTAHTHTAVQVSDSTATGRAVLTAADAATARTALGAGTSNLALGSTSDTAATGNHGHLAAGISDSTATGRAVLTAASTSAARSAIGAYAVAQVTQAAYDALPTKDPMTLYIIVG